MQSPATARNSRPVHPFPARMASEIAIKQLSMMPKGSIILDPMMGSGTVLRRASELGHKAIGFDMDPLAVLMSKVWTCPVDDETLNKMEQRIRQKYTRLRNPPLPWADKDKKTLDFMRFWFGEPQRLSLRKLAAALYQTGLEDLTTSERDSLDVLKLALSRIIITKERGASLARDTSHSRPHRVVETSDYDVFQNYFRSVAQIKRLLADSRPPGSVVTYRGDARVLAQPNESIDIVLTSPPYLNAIDYMRGHRLALVWLGYNLGSLGSVRSNSIGAERSLGTKTISAAIMLVAKSMCQNNALSSRYTNMIVRYSHDLCLLLNETYRVLKPGGKAIFVVGDSCLKDIFISNSEGVKQAAILAGLSVNWATERTLPNQSRYLPPPQEGTSSLTKRMRIETVLSFSKACEKTPHFNS